MTSANVASLQSLSRTKQWIAIALAGLVSALLGSPADARCTQPVYVIAHRCNDVGDVSSVVSSQGVNAVEADFRYSGGRWFVDHDAVYAHSTTLDSWLLDAQAAAAGSVLSLIVFDIKTFDANAIVELHDKARAALGPDINLIFSMGDFDEAGVFGYPLADVINRDPHAGAAVDLLTGSDTQYKVRDFFQSRGITKYWYADGWEEGALTPASVYTNVSAGIALRETQTEAFHGVHTWTYEKKKTIKDFLDRGVNGIIVNSWECFTIFGAPDDVWQPWETVAYAKTLPGKKYATPADNAFTLGPQITCPQDLTLECKTTGGTDGADPQITAFFNDVKLGDNCDAVSLAHDPPALFYGVNTQSAVNFTATDTTDLLSFGVYRRSTTCQSKINVKDTLKPSIICPDAMARDPESKDGAVVTFSATASDTCDPSPQYACSPASGSMFTIGRETPVSCTATDAAGNAAQCGFTVKIYSTAEVVGRLQAFVALAPGLSNGEATSLRSQLDVTLKAIGEGRIPTACGHIENFASKINKAIAKGNLTLVGGQPILGSAKNLYKTLACSGAL